MAIKLIALDIDGTLTPKAREISKRNLDAIRAAQQAGVFVTVATGRGVFSTRCIWDLMNIQGEAIQYGGAWIVDTRDGGTRYIDPLDPALVQDILAYAHSIGVFAQIYQDDVVVYEKSNAFADRYTSRHNLPYRIDPDIREKRFENVPKVLAFVDPSVEDRYRAMFTEYLAGRAHVSRSMPGYIEINGFDSTKGRALERLAGMRGVTREETAAVGDNYLDQDMIEWAGTGVCVADGAPEVRAAADLIVPACADDGVAAFIEQYVL